MLVLPSLAYSTKLPHPNQKVTVSLQTSGPHRMRHQREKIITLVSHSSFQVICCNLTQLLLLVSNELKHHNKTTRKHSNPFFVGKSDGNATDSSYYSAVDSEASPSGLGGSDSGLDHMDSSLKDEEIYSESSSSPFDDEDIVDEDFMNVEHQGGLFSTCKLS